MHTLAPKGVVAQFGALPPTMLGVLLTRLPEGRSYPPTYLVSAERDPSFSRLIERNRAILELEVRAAGVARPSWVQGSRSRLMRHSGALALVCVCSAAAAVVQERITSRPAAAWPQGRHAWDAELARMRVCVPEMSVFRGFGRQGLGA